MTDWHKYPDEKPTMSDDQQAFFVTFISRSGVRKVVDTWWDAMFRTFANIPSGIKIIAWARIKYPEPYQGD